MQFLEKYLLNGSAALLGLLGLYRLLDSFAINHVFNLYGIVFGIIQCTIAVFIVFRKPVARWLGILLGFCMVVSTVTILIVLRRLKSTLEIAPLLAERVGSPSTLDWISGIFGLVLIGVLYFMRHEFE